MIQEDGQDSVLGYEAYIMKKRKERISKLDHESDHLLNGLNIILGKKNELYMIDHEI